jgi:hypothetical protein
MKKIFYSASWVLLCLLLSSWGSKGHRIINRESADNYPQSLSFLKPAWTNIVTLNASEADYRKDTDPNEAPKHYIDIDNYPEFLQTGEISQSFDSVVALHGYAFVIDQGILPWATIIAFDSLKACFERYDWSKAALFAADLGHYIGDGHMPLHITRNYNGQYTGQTGIHSRYETQMVSRYESQLVFPADSAYYINNVSDFVFSYIYTNYAYVDSVLIADAEAHEAAGNVTSDAYYQALWTKSGPFTIGLLRQASYSLADLIYTAWVNAGSPLMYPVAIAEPENPDQPRLLQIFPNPVAQTVCFPVVVPDNDKPVTLMIYDNNGTLRDTVVNQVMDEGYHKITWDVKGLTPGIYYCKLQSGNTSSAQRFVVIP